MVDRFFDNSFSFVNMYCHRRCGMKRSVAVVAVTVLSALGSNAVADEAKKERSTSVTSIRAVSSFLMAPIGKTVTARFVVRVPRDSQNRWLIVSWDSPDPGTGAGSTGQELHGESSPAIFDFNRLHFSSGQYVVAAEVIRANGSSKITHTTVVVH
jgi:hypothetical protein